MNDLDTPRTKVTETVEVTVERKTCRWTTNPPEQMTVIVRGGGVEQQLGRWCFMCVPDAPDGARRSGPATEVSDEVVLEALFGDQHIYSTDPSPRVDITALGAHRYQVTVTR